MLLGWAFALDFDAGLSRWVLTPEWLLSFGRCEFVWVGGRTDAGVTVQRENGGGELRTLPALLAKDKNRNLVIYAEQIWLNSDELAAFAKEHGRTIRPMVVPFGLR